MFLIILFLFKTKSDSAKLFSSVIHCSTRRKRLAKNMKTFSISKKNEMKYDSPQQHLWIEWKAQKCDEIIENETSLNALTVV